jgi:UDP-N-acetylmuramyl tripeptide synthase
MRSTVTNLANLEYKRLFVILAIANTNKDSRVVIKLLASLAHEIVLTTFSRDNQHSIHPKVILSEVNRFKQKQTKVSVIKDLNEALDYCLAKSGPEDGILY